MGDYLDILAQDAKETVNEGYYEILTQNSTPSVSLKKAIIENKHNAVIAEIKAASPSKGAIITSLDPAKIAGAMKNGGAIAISVLTEPKHFKGSLNYLQKVREAVNLPILMKDIIVDHIQIEAASKIGANAVLLIEAIFERGYCKFNVNDVITRAHSKNLEVILEVHNENEFQYAIRTDADLIGINNRDLRTLNVDLQITEKLLKKTRSIDKVIVTESGVLTLEDLLFLRSCGAQAFLIGSSIMMSENVEQKVKEFVTAY